MELPQVYEHIDGAHKQTRTDARLTAVILISKPEIWHHPIALALSFSCKRTIPSCRHIRERVKAK